MASETFKVISIRIVNFICRSENLLTILISGVLIMKLTQPLTPMWVMVTLAPFGLRRDVVMKVSGSIGSTFRLIIVKLVTVIIVAGVRVMTSKFIVVRSLFVATTYRVFRWCIR